MSAAFQRIITVMLENATRESVLQNPYMNSLRSKGVFLANSFGVTHSSQPNYIAITGGDTFGIWNDDSGWVQWIYEPKAPPVTSIIDLLEAQGLTWKAYAEDLKKSDIVTDTSTTPPTGHGRFARKHVPFLSYPNIVTVPARAANIVNAEKHFEADRKAGKLPNYSFYTPNLINDGHSQTVSEQKVTRIDPQNSEAVNIDNIERFLKSFRGDDPIARFPPETLIAITFDEAYPYYEGYNIYTLLIGDMLEAGTVRTEPYNHYSLLRSVEVNFGTGTLRRNDTAATPYWFLPGS